MFLNNCVLILLSVNPFGRLVSAHDQRRQQLRTKPLSSYTPVRLPYQSLLFEAGSSSPISGDQNTKSNPLLDTLTDSGLVSITDIPGFALLKKDVMSHLQKCLDDKEESGNVQDHAYEDGTIRKTLSTITVPGPGGAQPLLDYKWSQKSSACESFIQMSDTFRALVQNVTNTFAHRLTKELGYSIRTPLMKTQHDEYTFPALEDIVKEGHHLEHFHSYQKTTANNKLQMNSSVFEYEQETATIELHTDQGFFIAFTPGAFMKKDDSSLSYLSSGFQIELSDGKRHLVSFEASDDLVFMMGDGVNQYINNNLYFTAETNSPKPLRATPHALYLPHHDEDFSRLWYGRMILPPPGAYNFQHSMTYGDIRSRLMKSTLSSNSNQLRGLGCSSTSMEARQLENVTCAPNSTWCWMRCMPWSDYGISDEICKSQQLGIQCINPRGQFYSDPTVHGDYYPACSNTTQPITPFNLLPNYPTDPKVCNSSRWNSFRSLSKDGTKYKYSLDLSVGNTTAAYFMWSILPDNKTIQGRLAFNGLFGYLAMGFRNTDTKGYNLNGMLGGKVLLALAGGNYSASTGLNMSLPGTLKEYQIDSSQTAFRFWNKPLSDNLLNKSAAIEINDCFTAITFSAEGIAGKKFNVSGTDSLMWAANAEDTFVAYHGYNRGRFAIEWRTGKASFGNVLNSSSPDNITSSSSMISVGKTIAGWIMMISALIVFSSM